MCLSGFSQSSAAVTQLPQFWFYTYYVASHLRLVSLYRDVLMQLRAHTLSTQSSPAVESIMSVRTLTATLATSEIAPAASQPILKQYPYLQARALQLLQSSHVTSLESVDTKLALVQKSFSIALDWYGYYMHTRMYTLSTYAHTHTTCPHHTHTHTHHSHTLVRVVGSTPT